MRAMEKHIILALLLILVLNSPKTSDAGTTSGFVRKLGPSQDMPLESDVFRVPPGYNAPQQVFPFLSLWLSVLLWLFQSCF